MLWLNILVIIIAYLIGSINPAYLLGKTIRHIDIREHGSKNAGAVNAWRVLGKGYSVITALFDTAKGFLVIAIAAWILKSSIFAIPFAQVVQLPLIVYIAGFAAIAGHNWPFYINFRGGKGAASAYGILILCMVLLIRQCLPAEAAEMSTLSLLALPFSTSLFIFLFFVAVILIITISANITSFIFIPALIFLINFLQPSQLSIFSSLILLYLLVVSIITVKQKGGLAKEIKLGKRKYKIKFWRKLLRVCGLILPVLYFFIAKKYMLVLVAAILLFFLYSDFSRARKKLSVLYKKTEGKISNISLFLISCLVTIAFFPREIAIFALSFLVVGDTAAEVIGLKFGKIKLIGEKTLEGSLACLASCFAIGLILMIFLPLSLLLVMAGSAAATFIELIPLRIGRFKIDDNLGMAIFAALVMWLVSFA